MAEKEAGTEAKGNPKKGLGKGAVIFAVMIAVLFILFFFKYTLGIPEDNEPMAYMEKAEDGVKSVNIEGVRYYLCEGIEYEAYELDSGMLAGYEQSVIETNDFNYNAFPFEKDGERRFLNAISTTAYRDGDEIKYHSRLYIREGYTYEDFIEFIEESEAVAQ